MSTHSTLLHPKECVNHMIVHLTQKGFVKPQTAQLSLNVAGRLNHFLENWKVLTIDKWVLDMVQGLWIPFVNLPVQVNCPNPPVYFKEQSLEEVGALLEKRAVVKLLNPQHQESFYLTFFLVPKKGWSDETSN